MNAISQERTLIANPNKREFLLFAAPELAKGRCVTFPLKLRFTVVNRTQHPLLLLSHFFLLNKAIRSHPESNGDEDRRVYAVNFPYLRKRARTFEVLPVGGIREPFLAVDSGRSEGEVREALNSQLVGEWRYSTTEYGPGKMPEYHVAKV